MEFDPWAEEDSRPAGLEESVPETFYAPMDDQSAPNVAANAVFPAAVLSSVCQVREIPQKEGLLFKHVNYNIIHESNKVVRRYSDFAWLVEFLLQKYPHRTIPQLPPKKFTGVGGADAIFLQRRRRGLQRFLNQLCSHPVLKDENIVLMFLSVPDDFSNWRKVAQIDWSNEFEVANLSKLPARLRINLDTVLNGLTENSNGDSNGIATHRQTNEAVINLLKHIWRENPLDINEMDFVLNVNVINVSLTQVAGLWAKMFSLIERIEKRELALVVDQLKFSNLIDELSKSDVGIYGMSTITGDSFEEEQNLSIINQTFKYVLNYFQTCKKDKTSEMIEITNVLETWKSLQDYFTSFHFLIERLTTFRLESEMEINNLLTDINKSIERFVQMKARLDFKPIHADKIVLSLNEDVQKLNKLIIKILSIKDAFVMEYQLFQKTKYTMIDVVSRWFTERAHLLDNNSQSIQRLLDVLGEIPN